MTCLAESGKRQSSKRKPIIMLRHTSIDHTAMSKSREPFTHDARAPTHTSCGHLHEHRMKRARKLEANICKPTAMASTSLKQRGIMSKMIFQLYIATSAENL